MQAAVLPCWRLRLVIRHRSLLLSARHRAVNLERAIPCVRLNAGRALIVRSPPQPPAVLVNDDGAIERIALAGGELARVHAIVGERHVRSGDDGARDACLVTRAKLVNVDEAGGDDGVRESAVGVWKLRLKCRQSARQAALGRRG